MAISKREVASGDWPALL